MGWRKPSYLSRDVELQETEKKSSFHMHFKSLREVKIPRFLRIPGPVNSKRIVLFVDASLQAYGAAVYIRCQCHNDAVTSRRGVSKEAKRDRGTNFVG